MLNIDESATLLESEFSDDYKEDLIVCRSFSSGINQSPASTNRLRVHSMDNKSPGPLRVRSSPSSPNRLSRLQCVPLGRKKWFALNKINQSSSSEFNSYPTSCNSNKSLLCDSNQEQLDRFWKNYSLKSRPKSCQSLQIKESYKHNEDDLYSFTKSVKSTIQCISQTNTVKAEYSEIDVHRGWATESQSESLIISGKSTSSPVNFKKALRDRYLNSQKKSNIGFFTSYSHPSAASSKICQSKSLNDDSFLNHKDFMLPENEDHNFYFMEEMNSRQSENMDNYDTDSIGNVYSKRALSIDLKKSTQKKYRILSNNSTISSMSGIEAEGDPFSPALTEICSPFLKLNLPYQVNQKQMLERCTPTPSLITSSSLGSLPLTHETENNCSLKTIKSLSTQRFFPESMKLSDFQINQPSKSECQLNYKIKEQLMLPNFFDGRISSKSAPQSLQLSPNCTNLLSGSITPIICPTTDSDEFLSRTGIINSEEDIYFMRPISYSKSMDYLDSWKIAVDTTNCIKMDDEYRDCVKKDVFKNKTLESINFPKSLQKSTCVSNQMPKKTIPVTSISNQRQCTVCGRYFNRSDMLARHSRVHTGHKPFECSICGQSFSRSDHLNTHMRIHSGEKPYRCSLCSYSACRRDMITRHLRVHRRKGDASVDSISVLVVNTQKTNTNHQKYSLTKSNNSLNIDPGSINDIEFSTIHRSQSFTDNQSFTFVDQNPSPRITDISHIVPKTFANISISICQPTPRSSFSMPTESQTDS